MSFGHQNKRCNGCILPIWYCLLVMRSVDINVWKVRPFPIKNIETIFQNYIFGINSENEISDEHVWNYQFSQFYHLSGNDVPSSPTTEFRPIVLRLLAFSCCSAVRPISNDRRKNLNKFSSVLGSWHGESFTYCSSFAEWTMSSRITSLDLGPVFTLLIQLAVGPLFLFSLSSSSFLYIAITDLVFVQIFSKRCHFPVCVYFATMSHCTSSCYTSWTRPDIWWLHSLCYMTRVGQWLRLALSKGPNRVGVFLVWPEDGNRSRFLNGVFSSFRIPDDGQSPEP
jgi:hypothetical protein